MEITKEQIQSIENRLEKNGINYWDIRIEILDHVVSDIENRIEKGESYKSALDNAFFSLGLSGNLDHLTRSRLLTINKIVRKQYFTNVKKLFTAPFSLLMMLLAISIYYLIFSFASEFVFKTMTFILLLAPIIVGVILYFSEFLQKKKSGYIVYSSFYIFFSFMMLNGFIQLVKPDGMIPVTKETQLVVWFLVTCINGVFTSAGIITHLNTVKKLKAFQNKRISE